MQAEHAPTGTKSQGPSSQGAALGPNSARLGGARADFVAGLGRKVADLRVALASVKTSEDDAPARDELRRKLHALGKSAKMMKFDAMDRGIAEAVGTLDRAKRDVRLDEVDVDAIEHLVEDLPALAWGDSRVRPSGTTPADKARAPKYRILVVGTSAIADALLDDVHARSTFICESTPDTQAAYDLVRTTEPDLVVLDADLADADELAFALLDDSLTEAVPIVVVGSFLGQGEAARYVAMGVAKTVNKPTTRETLRAACEETLLPVHGTSNAHVLLGEPTLEELGDRLAAELRDALVGRADPAGRSIRIPLGQGTEVLGAVWGAIARIREVVTSRSDGAIRFAGGPEGALTPAPLLEADIARSDRRRPRRNVASEVKLEGRRVVVADDDPAVVWFLADLLRTAGCVVYEAFDGKQALDLAWEHAPDLVISDILMPQVDGFSLCRALRRDVALRDTPVILLSWKEDLLQRVRELGAGAAGYVRKESDTRAIIARVREALQARGRIEARLHEDGEVRGRLDGISTRTLLEVVAAIRPDARVSVRDASFLYEVEIREGRPYRVTRTDGDGGFVKGEKVLAQLLGVSAGRFYVTSSTNPIVPEVQGTLAMQLAGPIAKSRAVTTLVTSPQASTVARLRFDEAALDDYLKATPERAQLVVRRLVNGAAPRELVLCGGCDASFLDDLLCDLSARGHIVGVDDADGKDLLPLALEKAVSSVDVDLAPACSKDEAAVICESPSPGIASSLEDAVLREVQHRSPEPSTAVSTGEPSIVDPKELRVRSSMMPAADELIPGSDAFVAAEPAEAAETAEASVEAPAIVAEQTLVDGTLYGGDRVESAAAPVVDTIADDAPVTSSAIGVGETQEGARDVEMPEAEASAVEKHDSLTPFASVTATVGDDVTVPGLEKRKRWPMIAFVTATGIVAWAVLHFSINGSTQKKQQKQLEAPPAEMPLPPAASSASTIEKTTEKADEKSSEVFYTPVATPAALPTGHGVIDVSAPEGALVLVDGKERARGSVKVHAPAGNHDVRVRRTSSDERGCTIDVHTSRVAHVRF